MRYRCNKNGRTWIADESDPMSDFEPAFCTLYEPRAVVINGPGDYGPNSPSRPDYPVSDPGTNDPLTEYDDTTDGARPKAKAKSAKSAAAGGCCAPGEPKCLWCWLKENWIQLAILALAVAAFVTRKK